MAKTTRLVTQPTEWQIGWSTNSTNTAAYAPEAADSAPVTNSATGLLVIEPGYANFLELMFAGAESDDGFRVSVYRWQKIKTSSGGSTDTYIPSSVFTADVCLGDMAAGVDADTSYSDPDSGSSLGKTIIKLNGDPAVKVTNPELDGHMASALLDCQGAAYIAINIKCDGAVTTSNFLAATDANLFWRLV
tara:strand:- start:248 stop:817 length:570 start_codon:yes stop_codon:yes gene_type:complete